MRTIRSLLTAAPAMAVLAAAMAVGTAAPAQAAVASAHHPAVTAGVRPASVAARHTLSVPPDEHAPGGVRPNTAGTLANGQNSYNWSGYAAAGHTYTSVSASWVQPAAKCNAEGAAAFWVGLDGDSSSDDAVEQTGTTADCTSGSPVYYGWYELFPLAPVQYSGTVDPGDNLSASVTYTGGGYYDLDLVDVTRGWTENHSYYDPGQADSSAEIIAEAPSDGSIEPLPDFGSVGFSSSRINGAAPAASGAQAITMINSGGTALDLVSPDTSAGNFMITYGSGANVTGSPVIAFEANDTSLWGSSSGTGGYLGQNMAPGTSPSIAALPGGGFEGAFQNSNGQLEVFGTAFDYNTQAGMMPGTSPSIAVSSSGTFEVVFQANTGALWYFTVATGGVNDSYGMMAGTSPSITALPSGGFEIAFQANSGVLWVVGSAATVDTQSGMMAGTSPSIAASSSGTFEVAYQANTGVLWDYTTAAFTDAGYGMMAGTSPSITALAGGGYETAFQANSGILWEVGSYISFNTELGMMAGTSPSIASASGVEFNVAFEADTGELWVQNLATGGVDWYSGMYGASGPAIAP